MSNIIQTLWIGDSLSPMERLCLASFVYHGHDVHHGHDVSHDHDVHLVGIRHVHHDHDVCHDDYVHHDHDVML